MAGLNEKPRPKGEMDFKRRQLNKFLNEHPDWLWKNTADMVEVHYPGGFLETINQKINVEGYVPFFCHTHRSHADIFSMQRAAAPVIEMCPSIRGGVVVPDAMTIGTGDQGEDLKGHYATLAPWLHEHRIHLVNVVRAADRRQYGIDAKGFNPEELLVLPNSELRLAIGEFPEATTTGGKIGPAGVPNGIQDFNDGGFMWLYTNAQIEAGRKVLFIVISSTGTELIHNPDEKRTATTGYDAFFKNQLLGLIPFGDHRIKLAHSFVATVTSDEVIAALGGGKIRPKSMYRFIKEILIDTNPKVVGPGTTR
jgi:hypothetical protein